MSRIPLAVQLYSLREDCALDLPGTLKSVADMGYEAVEFAGYYGYSAQDLKVMLDDLGLKCAGTHTSLVSVQGEELKRTAEFNAILGNPYLVVPGVNHENYAGREGAARLGEELSQASVAAGEFGARVGYHNHSWEFKTLPDGGVPMDIIFEKADASVILQGDTGNAQEGAGDCTPLLEKYKNRAVTVHLKPFAADFSKYFVGEDETNWSGVFTALSGGATVYYIVEQERYPEPLTPKECVARCLKNLKAMGL